ncbi:uncharacterized protein LOC125480683 [Pyrus x bretschneideri]|uniref:uncharacterized protein LOC125480683 n=1 Tax=Pyrus x bretschneideri TaxID=225117 RepID=UPI00202FE78A|nr:uncharacterized protein LOC125480683 [Pyrus x bretschneideri]
MDFIVGLPNCKGKSVIMVIVDRLSKYNHLIAPAYPYNASIVAQLFIEHVFRLHGMPNSIMSDRDPVFVSAFWKELFRLQGSKLCMSSGYHPQTDRQTELAQNRMKVQADKKRTERHFNIGDMVYLKLVPYQLHSLVNHSYHKLQPRFYGPYAVLEKIGVVAYKLKLPEGSKVHPVFHVSYLKKQVGNNVTPQIELPLVSEDGLVQDIPATIMSRRMYKKGNVAGVQLLVQWKGKEVADATWEDFDEFQQRFLGFVV